MATLNEQQQRLVDQPLYAVATTVMSDGAPHSTVVWIDRDDGTLQFNTARGRLKARNLERDPRISVAVFDPASPFEKTLIVRGRAQLVDAGADDHIDRLAKKYTGQDRYPWRRPGERRVTVRVHADRITGSDG